MNITIKPLSPDLALTYIDYLEKMDFQHAPDWSGCFCRFYHSACTDLQWKARTPEENKAEAFSAIQEGSMKGFLAFHDDQCVAWVNANNIKAYPKLQEFLDLPIILPQTACIVCFVIHPQFRNQGIARQLIDACVLAYENEGYDALMGFPFENINSPEKAYHGTPKMYLEKGFECLEEREGIFMMRKVFKK
ncbi:MAG: GNAT family N-acetyltransferase [Erysipelotrichaceae bacterium]|nr:GNAT family N-acetyltransferase [Erysipelotrichaceae bacterium]